MGEKRRSRGVGSVNADDVRRTWARRSAEFSPEYYAYYGPNETSERVRRVLDRFLGPEAAVLELGCSSGRHLAHLHEHGYRDLHGVDLNDDAFDVMAETYPALAADGTFHHGAFEDVLPDFADGQFDAAFSVESLQHVHDDATWAFAEVARVAEELVVTVECESPTAPEEHPEEPTVNYVDDDIPLYYRDWEAVFTGLGLEAVTTETLDRDTLRVFRHR